MVAYTCELNGECNVSGLSYIMRLPRANKNARFVDNFIQAWGRFPLQWLLCRRSVRSVVQDGGRHEVLVASTSRPTPGPCFNTKTIFPIIGSLIIKIRRLRYRVIFYPRTDKRTYLYWDDRLSPKWVYMHVGVCLPWNLFWYPNGTIYNYRMHKQ